jgi:hypothetical protein
MLDIWEEIMIDISNVNVAGFIPAIKGIRNSYQSYDKSDTDFGIIGDNDKKLMRKLVKAGEPHCKFRRMIQVWADIDAPLFWWKQYDTYKVGTVANSESTMHNICDREFTYEDFGIDLKYVNNEELCTHWYDTIYILNRMRHSYLEAKAKNNNEQAALIQRWIYELLPSAYMQKRTVNLNYSVLAAIYKQRKYHKLNEWLDFCEWIESLPESWIITGD